MASWRGFSMPGLLNSAAETGMPALAITDHGTMFGVIDFYRACQAQGIKPIIGVEAYLARRGMTDDERVSKGMPRYTILCVGLPPVYWRAAPPEPPPEYVAHNSDPPKGSS